VGYVFDAKIKGIVLALSLALQLILGAVSLSASEPSEENRVMAVAEKMEAAFKEVKDYTCDIDHIYFKDGVEDQRYRLKFYFKKKKRIRIDFSAPYPELTLCYQGNDEKVTVIPLRFFSFLNFHYSVDNPKVLTPAGQRINQTDIGFFVEFLIRSLKTVPQGEEEYREEAGRVTFQFQALDYTGGSLPEKYQLTVSSGDWFPIRIERKTAKGKPIEISMLQNFRINTHLEDKLFVP
jgi:outer membrane lipoprotein-sorting protein